MSSRDSSSISFLNSDVINDDFFIDIVERKLNIKRDQFKLRLVYISNATGKNENYASIVYRAKINIELLESKERKFVNVIIKALLITIEELKEFAIFDREIVMYNDVLPSFEKILSDSVEFGPKCIKVESKPYEIIVLEDLNASGYEMMDRKVGLDFEQSKLVMKKLAKFHAASAIRYQKDNEISFHLDRLAMMQNESMNSPEQFQKSTQMFGGMFQEFAKTAASIEGCEKIAAKIAQWDLMKIMSVFMAIAEPMRCGLKVLNHGDDWVNNMMFKFNDGIVEDVKFIDFQLSFWGSPANDLIYFFVSSVKDDIKTEVFDDLLEVYHAELESTLKNFNYDGKIPTLSEIQIDLLEKGGAFGFHMFFVMFVVKFDSNTELDIANFMDPDRADPKMIDAVFSNENYKNAVKTWLPFLNRRGFLDVLLPQAPLTPFMEALMQQMPQPPQANGINEEQPSSTQ